MTTDTEPVSSCIGLDWTDESLVLFLLDFKIGDSLPSNVIGSEDPFRIEPWHAPAGTWFLCNPKDSERQKIRSMGDGYWEQIDNNTKISWGNLAEGRKIFWEFYVGREPTGHRTGWQMLEYHVEQKEVQAANDKQANDLSSMCRIYFKDIDAPILEDGHGHFEADENKDDYIEDELLRMLKDEEGTFLATKSQVPSGEEQGPLSGVGRSLKESSPDNIADMHPSFDCFSEDFLELKDFENNHGSRSSFDNSSCFSGTSDECFDSMAVLLDLGSENIIPTESREYSTCHSLGMNLVAIEPTPPASSQGSGNDLLKEDMSSVSAPTNRRRVEISTPSSSGLLSINKSLASGSGEASRLKRAASRSSEGSGSSRGSRGSSAGNGSSNASGGRSPVARIKRLGKKYCCLSSF